MKKKIIASVLLIAAMLTFCSCSKKPVVVKNELPQLCTPTTGDTIVVIETDKGRISAIIFESIVPENTKNFLRLVDTGYYDGIVIHKAIENFVVQMGDPTGAGDGGDSATGRGVAQEYDERLHHFTGALAMAASEDGLNRSQFYIVAGGEVGDEYVAAMKQAGYPQNVIDAYVEKGGQPSLDYNYTVIGQVYEGMDIVQKIAGAKTDKYNRPVKDITITAITVYTYD